MASRLIFIALENEIGVKIVQIKFEYFTGFSIAQKQKSIISLHQNAEKEGYKNILEASTKSLDELGVMLSAFNLSTKTQKKNYEFSVERAFQSSKVFEDGGPYIDILHKTSKEAKMDERLRNSGKLLKFRFYNYTFDINPPTYFYDWLYINTLIKNTNLIEKIRKYKIFSDIEFNHEKSTNCQAYSLALFKSLLNNNISMIELKNPEYFLKYTNNEYNKRWNVAKENIKK
jgi:hypothetical protein